MVTFWLYFLSIAYYEKLSLFISRFFAINYIQYPRLLISFFRNFANKMF